MSDVAIRVDGLSKLYSIGVAQPRYDTLRDRLADTFVSPFRRLWSAVNGSPSASKDRDDTVWALKDVSFEVNRGEVVGVIGRNGAGKTTLLKILSRITEPTEGRAEIHGRVGSLLEVGTGFHPELTGRENISLNSAILGMTKVETNRKFDEIVEFAEIDRFIDTPVKRYSSGMYVRLAFAVAAHLESDILLVDEVLAVGDAAFQKKCLGKMGDAARGGKTVLFVSHNMAAVENLCEHAFLLENGRVAKRDKTQLVIRDYLEGVLPSIISVPLTERNEHRSGNGVVRFTKFHLEDSNHEFVTTLRSGEDTFFVFSFSCATGNHPRDVSVGFGPFDKEGRLLFVLYSSYVGHDFERIPAEGQFRCFIPHLPLAPGRYRIGARITVGRDEADWPKDGIAYIDVEQGDFFGTGNLGFGSKCSFLVNGSWSLGTRITQQ